MPWPAWARELFILFRSWLAAGPSGALARREPAPPTLRAPMERCCPTTSAYASNVVADWDMDRGERFRAAATLEVSKEPSWVVAKFRRYQRASSPPVVFQAAERRSLRTRQDQERYPYLRVLIVSRLNSAATIAVKRGGGVRHGFETFPLSSCRSLMRQHLDCMLWQCQQQVRMLPAILLPRWPFEQS